MCATARCPTPFKKSFIAIQNHSKTIQKLSKAHEQAHGTLQTHAHGQAHQHAASKSSTSTRTATLLFTLQSLDTVHCQAGKDGSTTTFRRQEGWIGRMVVHTLQTALGAWWGQETCTINLHMNTQLAQSMCRAFRIRRHSCQCHPHTYRNTHAGNTVRRDTTRNYMLEVPWPTHSP